MVSFVDRLKDFMDAWFEDPIIHPLEITVPPEPAVLYRIVDGIYAFEVPVPTFWLERTSLEKILLVTGLFWLLWKLIDLRVQTYVRPLCNFFVPGFKWFVGKIRQPPIVYTAPMQMEAIRIGSDEMDLSRPKCQCDIGVLIDGELRLIGCAVRFPHNALVAPDHVLVNKEGVKKYAVGKQGRVCIDDIELTELDSDLAFMTLTEAQFSLIGISAAKIKILPFNGETVTVVAGNGRGTMSVLRSDPKLFGHVVYDGSTTHGYSGAAYRAGEAVIGLHAYGGPSINGGFNASYVWAILKKTIGRADEDSDDWIFGQFNSGVKIKQKEWDLEDVILEIGGQFHTVKRYNMIKVFGQNYRAMGEEFSNNEYSNNYDDRNEYDEQQPDYQEFDYKVKKDHRNRRRRRQQHEAVPLESFVPSFMPKQVASFTMEADVPQPAPRASVVPNSGEANSSKPVQTTPGVSSVLTPEVSSGTRVPQYSTSALSSSVRPRRKPFRRYALPSGVAPTSMVGQALMREN